jgi:ABC-type branched-subunit amino acid transport system ATPase component
MDIEIFQEKANPHGGGEAVILRAAALKKSYGGQMILDGVNLELREGQVVLLRGDNGSGKTTLLNILTGNLEPDAGIIEFKTDGNLETFSFPRKLHQKLNPFDRFRANSIARKHIGRTWQDIRLFSTQNLLNNIAVAPQKQIGENLLAAFPPFIYFATKQNQEINKKSEEKLNDLGLLDRKYSSADMVSLGQAKRVSIARAIAAGAKILFLDEPLSGLDSNGIAEVHKYLKQLIAAKQTTFIIIEHIYNIPKILDITTNVWSLRDGKIVYEAINSVRDEYNDASSDVLNKLMLEIAGEKGKISHQELPGGSRLSTVISPNSTSSEVILKVDNIVVHRNKRLVIGKQEAYGNLGISLTFNRGQISFLQAPNGWGKTTLLEAIAGLLPISQGHIYLHGKPIQALSLKERFLLYIVFRLENIVQFLLKDSKISIFKASPNPQLKPWELSKKGLVFLRSSKHSFPTLTVQETIRLSGLNIVPNDIDYLLNKRISDLSGGEKQKVAISCILGRSADFMLLDEPFSALDPIGIKMLCNNLKLSNKSILVAVPSTII